MRGLTHDELQSLILVGLVLTRLVPRVRSLWDRLREARRVRARRLGELKAAQQLIRDDVDRMADAVRVEARRRLWAIRADGSDVA